MREESDTSSAAKGLPRSPGRQKLSGACNGLLILAVSAADLLASWPHLRWDLAEDSSVGSKHDQGRQVESKRV